MCGLCGIARHPGGKPLAEMQELMTALLKANEPRGHHATGVAAPMSVERQIVKTAIEPSKFVKGANYRAFMEHADATNQRVIIGHTRHATHQNAHLDEAAHPFRDGDIIGAHNGVIYNWREVEAQLRQAAVKNAEAADNFTLELPPRWCNDSQAAFGVLAAKKNPVKALDALDGWWALTWAKGNSLFMCRTDNVPLHAAYIGAWRTLVWSSTEEALKLALRSAGTLPADYDMWQLKPNTIYRYDPRQFTDTSARAERVDAPFRGIRSAKGRSFNSAAPDMMGGFSTTRKYTGGSSWDAEKAREVFDTPPRGKKQKSNPTRSDGLPSRPRIMAVGDIEKELQKLYTTIEQQQAMLNVQDAEIEYIYRLLNEKRPEVFEESPYADDPTCGGQQLLLGAPTCVECSKQGGVMLALPDGGWIHEACVMTDATGVSA